jgi:hypothetical protein
MSIYTIPAPDAPAEEWGRVAVALPGWRWMPGMRVLRTTHPVVQARGGPVVVPVRLIDSITNAEEIGGTTLLHGNLLDSGHAVADGYHRAADMLPDLDDPATEGCLLRLLGDRALLLDLPTAKTAPGLWRAFVSRQSPCFTERLPLGRACIAAAAALGRWPGGEG